MRAAVASTSVLLTLAALAFTVWSARAATRIRVWFDIARSVVAVVAIVVMAAITGVATRSELLAGAVVAGGALGIAQGAVLRVEAGERGLMARRSPIGLVLWGAGIVVMQVGGVLTRTGAIRIGQTLAVFSAALGIGLLLGRRVPMARARNRSVAGRAVAGVAAAVVVLVVLAGVGGSWAPGRAIAQGEITYEGEVAVANRPPLEPYYLDSSSVRLVVAGDVVTATIEFTLVAALKVTGDEATCLGTIYRAYAGQAPLATTVSVELSLTDSSNDLAGDCEGVTAPVIATQTLTGSFSDDGRFVGNIRDVWSITAVKTGEVTEPPAPTVTEPPEPTVTEPPEPPVTAPPPTVDRTPDVDASSSAGGGPADDVTPGEAAASAAAGLVAAAAIGLITWGEAAGELGGSGGGPRRGGAGAPTPEPFLDPLDGRPLPVDSATGRVWWPWDGGSGHWVDPSEAPGLLAQWERELEAENARRIGRHDAQREQNWDDLHDRIRRSEAGDAARRAGEQARLDAFDRRVAAARVWMEEADAGSLDRLDRIVERAANQGFVTDEDLAQAAGIADRARVWADTRRQWDAEDWIRITANRNAVLGVTAKGISVLIDPTKGLTSGFIWGVAESWDRGDDLATVVANGVFEGAVLRGGYAAGTWGPGRAVLGSIGWGSMSGAATAAAETLLRGGTLEEAWEASKTGFVLGGLGGVVEDAAAGRPPPEVPVIRNRPGGGTHWDQPLSPRHVDPGDPRYHPPGTPAEQIHLPPTSPWGWSQPPPTLGETAPHGAGAVADGVSVPGDRPAGGRVGAGRGAVGAADELVVERGPVDVNRPPPADVVAPEAGPWQAVPDGRPAPPVGSVGDEIVMERIEPARFPRQPPPFFVPEEPPASPVPPVSGEPTVGIGDPRFRVGEAPEGALPGWGPEVPDIPPVWPGPIEDVQTGSPGIDAAVLPDRPAILDGVEIDLGWVEHAPSPPDWVGEIDIGLPRTSGPVVPEPPVTASPPEPSSPGPMPTAPAPSAPAPSPPPASSVPRDQALSDAVFRGDVDLPAGVVDEVEVRGDELFSGTQHGGQGGWSAEALAREETFWRSDGTIIPGSDAVDVLPGRGQFNLSYNQRTGRATVHFGPGLTEGQKRQLLRPGGPVEQTVAKVRTRVGEVTVDER